MALVFMVAGVIGLVVTLLAMRTRSYRNLSAQFAESGPAAEPTEALEADNESRQGAQHSGA